MSQPFRALPILTLLSVAILSSAVFGCSGTDVDITSLHELRDANAAIFATHADETVWLVQAGQLSKFGRAPFGVAASGKVVVAVDLRVPSTVVLWTGTSATHTVDLRKTGRSRRFGVANLRCDDDSILVRLVCTDGRSDKVDSKLIRVRVQDLTQSSATESEWMSIQEGRPAVAKQERRGDATLDFYELSNGDAIVRRLAPREISTISYLRSDGSARELLREDRGRYLSRRMANAGMKYP